MGLTATTSYDRPIGGLSIPEEKAQPKVIEPPKPNKVSAAVAPLTIQSESKSPAVPRSQDVKGSDDPGVALRSSLETSNAILRPVRIIRYYIIMLIIEYIWM